MAKFPKDAPETSRRQDVGAARVPPRAQHEHISMVRDNADGTQTPLTMPNHRRIKGSTLRTICTQAGIARRDFLNVFKDT